MKRFQNRKLTRADGERILWHVLFGLRSELEHESAECIKKLLDEHFIPKRNS
jgi:hypothetical protein